MNCFRISGCVSEDILFTHWLSIFGTLFLRNWVSPAPRATWSIRAWTIDILFHVCRYSINFTLIGNYHYHFWSLILCHLLGRQDSQIDNINMLCPFHAVALRSFKGHFCKVLWSSGMIFLLRLCTKFCRPSSGAAIQL